MVDTPFYLDQEILVSIEDVREMYREGLSKSDDLQDVQILSLKGMKISEYRRTYGGGDRILSNLRLDDEDVVVIMILGIEGQEQSVMLCFRKVNQEIRMAGFWSTPTPEPTEDAALDFSLAVVETYFTGDADKFCSYLADTLYTLEGEGPFTKEEAISIIKEDKPFPFGKDYSEFTMEDYLENYRPKIMDYREYSKEYPELSSLSIDGWKPDADDFLFLGYEVKRGKEGFMWDDLLGFMVTYQNKKWEFIVFGS
jgi:hypothetical protein